MEQSVAMDTSDVDNTGTDRIKSVIDHDHDHDHVL